MTLTSFLRCDQARVSGRFDLDRLAAALRRRLKRALARARQPRQPNHWDAVLGGTRPRGSTSPWRSPMNPSVKFAIAFIANRTAPKPGAVAVVRETVGDRLPAQLPPRGLRRHGPSARPLWPGPMRAKLTSQWPRSSPQP